MALVYLGLGTNLGNKEQHLNNAILKLSSEVGILVFQSAFYSSVPWGFDSENEFLNAVVLLETYLSPFDLLAKTQDIELKMGRTVKPTTDYSDRLIDIDILLYDSLIITEPTLKIPHPLMLERDFVLKPLMEIAPDLVYPISGKKVKDIVAENKV